MSNEKSANVPTVTVVVAEDQTSAKVTVRGFQTHTVKMDAAFRAMAIAMGLRQSAADKGASPAGTSKVDRLTQMESRVLWWAEKGIWAKPVDRAAIEAQAAVKATETAKAKLIESINQMKLPEASKKMMIEALG